VISLLDRGNYDGRPRTGRPANEPTSLPKPSRYAQGRLPVLAHHVVRALLRMAASGRSGPKRYLGGPLRSAGSRSISRPSDRSTEPASGLGPLGHDRSAKNSAAYATRASMTQTIRTGATVACMLHRGSRINLYPVERPRLVPKSCILVAARLQDGWDSSLVRLIRPTRHPQSHIRPGSGPEAWAKLIELVTQ
jgi:hypothetical protein